MSGGEREGRDERSVGNDQLRPGEEDLERPDSLVYDECAESFGRASGPAEGEEGRKA